MHVDVFVMLILKLDILFRVFPFNMQCRDVNVLGLSNLSSFMKNIKLKKQII